VGWVRELSFPRLDGCIWCFTRAREYQIAPNFARICGTAKTEGAAAARTRVAFDRLAADRRPRRASVADPLPVVYAASACYSWSRPPRWSGRPRLCLAAALLVTSPLTWITAMSGGLRSRAERLQRALIGLVGGEARNRELLQPPLRHLLAEKAPTIVSTIQTAATMPRSRTIASARRARDPRGASPVSVVSRDQLLSASRSLRAASWEAAA
jgi:hypothetical protein